MISSVDRVIDSEYDDYQPPVRRPERMEAPPRKRRRKKRHGFRNFVIILLCVVLAVALFWNFYGKQPVSESSAMARKSGFSTILIIGTDDGGWRTDTMMLVSIDSKNKTVSLLSIPRDTYVYGGYRVPKINAAYGNAGRGDAGMEELMTRISEITGYRPDGYVMVSLSAFVNIVDIMGGVEFDVPQDMNYSDPAQDLYIDLKAGPQTLNGQQAMGLVRFRSGYAMADLTRVSVQRDFVKAAMSQWIKPGIILKAPKLMGIVAENTTTDLDKRNMMWLCKALLSCDRENMVMETLPGTPVIWSFGAYYVLDQGKTLELINRSFNPYESPITADMVKIREEEG